MTREELHELEMRFRANGALSQGEIRRLIEAARASTQPLPKSRDGCGGRPCTVEISGQPQLD